MKTIFFVNILNIATMPNLGLMDPCRWLQDPSNMAKIKATPIFGWLWSHQYWSTKVVTKNSAFLKTSKRKFQNFVRILLSLVPQFNYQKTLITHAFGKFRHGWGKPAIRVYIVTEIGIPGNRDRYTL